MTPTLSTLKSAGRALIVAAVLGASSMAAAPAFAQDPSFNFSLGIGGSGQPSFGFEVQGGDDSNGFRRPGRNFCMSDRQVIRGLRDQGFSRIEITQSSRRHAEAVARYGRGSYHVDVNKCTGEVDVERIRRERGNGFGLQFNFGN